MRFAYIVFLALWSMIAIVLSGVYTFALCKSQKGTEIAGCIALIIFFVGALAQFIADGIRIIGN